MGQIGKNTCLQNFKGESFTQNYGAIKRKKIGEEKELEYKPVPNHHLHSTDDKGIAVSVGVSDLVNIDQLVSQTSIERGRIEKAIKQCRAKNLDQMIIIGENSLYHFDLVPKNDIQRNENELFSNLPDGTVNV